MSSDIKTKARKVHAVATDLFGRGPDWVTFFRETVGMDGIVQLAFPDPESLAAFMLTDEYAAIEQMLTRLREKVDLYPPKENTRVITIRLPQSLHDSLTDEAKSHDTSVNKLCISKLMRIIEKEFVPNSKLED